MNEKERILPPPAELSDENLDAVTGGYVGGSITVGFRVFVNEDEGFTCPKCRTTVNGGGVTTAVCWCGYHWQYEPPCWWKVTSK